MTAYGDNISPFEDGFYVYDIDARTYYAGVSYSILDIDLSALYPTFPLTHNDEGGSTPMNL